MRTRHPLPSAATVLRRSAPLLVFLGGAALLTAAAMNVQDDTPVRAPVVIPKPVSMEPGAGAAFTLGPDVRVVVPADDAEVERVGRDLAALLGRALEAPPLVEAGPASGRGQITLELGGSHADLGDEGYELNVSSDDVRVRAARPAGIFYGVQTLRQLLPAAVEHRGLRPQPMKIPAVRVVDSPRFPWRGAMLDVSRHFFGPAEVRRYVDLLALYKINRLHLHLSDDQGWRIEIASWPNLTTHGGSTAVGGGPGGFYTQAEYRELVAYAAERFITIVPEIDMPGHTNAALASYPELNCDGAAPPLYSGIDVGFSSLCVDKDVTYRFIDDVVGEIAALTPGRWFHLGGDEVKTLTPQQYATFVERVQEIVRRHGKEAIGWDEIAASSLDPSTIVQHWRPEAGEELSRARRLILSPASRVYLDMKYHAGTPIGLNWAGNVGVEESYAWDPSDLLEGVARDAVLGVEAPLWSETLVTMDDVEFMAFPRLPGVAEIGWSPEAARGWPDYAARLAAQAPRWSALGINAYWAPEIAWER